MRRVGTAAAAAEELGTHYRRDKWVYSTPLCDVYAGEDQNLHRDVHLRFFTPRVMRDPVSAAAVLAAAKAAAAVVDPRLVAVYDFGTIGGRLCMVTEVAGPPPTPPSPSTDELMGLANADAFRAARALGLERTDAAAFDDAAVEPVDVEPAPVDVTHTVTMPVPPVVEDPSPIPVQPPVDPSPEPIPVATTAEPSSPPARPRRRPRLPAGAAARLAPLAAIAATVIALLVIAVNDDPPPIPGLPTGGHSHHTDLPPQIPQ